MSALDLRLYLVTDPSFGTDLRHVVVPAVEGGVTCVQVRDKDATPDALAAQVVGLCGALAGSGVPVLTNDHLVAEADGVHVGRSDEHPVALRARTDADTVVGWSLEHLGQLDDVPALEACSYVAVSTVHPTPTKRDTAPAHGLTGVRAIVDRVDGRLPVVGIGGLDVTNAADAVAAGLDGLAVVRAIGAHDDPRTAARRLRRIVDDALVIRAGGGVV